MQLFLQKIWKSNNTWNIRQTLVNESIIPATQRIILKIVGFIIDRNCLVVKAKRHHIFWTNAYKNGHCGQAGNVLWVHAELFFCTFDGYFCILYVCSQLELCQGHLREQSTRIKTFSVSLMINMFDIELKCIFLQKKTVCILD